MVKGEVTAFRPYKKLIMVDTALFEFSELVLKKCDEELQGIKNLIYRIVFSVLRSRIKLRNSFGNSVIDS